MCHFLHMPHTMNTCEYIARLIEIDNYIPQFLPVTVGGTALQKLPDEELVDLLEFGVPNSWQKAMILRDFDPLQNMVQDCVQFCKRLEQVDSTEGTNQSSQNSQKNKNKSTGRTGKRSRDHDNSDSGKKHKLCLLHGDNCGHSTDDCFALKAQPKRMKQTYETQAPEKKKAYKQKQELNAIVAEAVENTLNDKKRKYAKAAKKAEKEEKVEELHQFKNISLSSEEDDKSTTSAES